MPRTKISEFSATAADNTDIDGINIAEGCAPSVINNAIRELMSQLKDFQTGAGSDPFNGAVNGTIGATTPAAGNFTTLGASSTATLNTLASSGATLTGGSINGMAIGGTTAAAGKFTTLEATGVTTVQAGTVSAPAITTTGDTNTGIFFPAADTIAFAEGGAEAMRITSAGNVGIGTSSPARRVDVRSTSSDYQYRAGDSANPVLSYDFGRENTAGLFKFYGNQTGATGYIFDGVDGERMRITTTGNVGIGTSAAYDANTRLTLSKAGSCSLVMRDSTNSVDGFFSVAATSVNLGSLTNHPVNFYSNNTVKATLTAGGDLGIGTANPSRKMSVSGASTQGYGIQFTDNTEVASFFANMVTGETRLYGNANYFYTIYTNNAERMRIASNGIVTMSAYGAGAATFSAAGVISSVSDETWKTKDGVPLNPDAMLQNLEPGYWFYNEEKAPIFGTDRQLGFYAQNVHEAIGNEAAPTPEEGKPWGYYDRSVLAVAVMSLKNALFTIEELKERIATLENK
jgi:hypothetical protein